METTGHVNYAKEETIPYETIGHTGNEGLTRFTKVQRLTLPHIKCLRTPFYTGHDSDEHNEMFWKEVQILQGRPHIVNLIGSYNQNHFEESFLLYSYYETNLKSFLHRSPIPSLRLLDYPNTLLQWMIDLT